MHKCIFSILNLKFQKDNKAVKTILEETKEKTNREGVTTKEKEEIEEIEDQDQNKEIKETIAEDKEDQDQGQGKILFRENL